MSASVYFPESLDTIGENIKEVKTRVCQLSLLEKEMLRIKIIAKGEELTGIKRKLFFWAVELGEEYDVIGKSAYGTILN
ncbi:MAG: hypothetical protein R2779_08080 [Crocinitomicaceae bacterium]